MQSLLPPEQYVAKYQPRYNQVLEQCTQLLNELVLGSASSVEYANILLNNINNQELE